MINTNKTQWVLFLVGMVVLLANGLCASAQEERQRDASPAVGPQVAVEKAEVPGKANLDKPGDPMLQTRNPRYRLRYGDVIEIKLPLTPDFNQTVTIKPDGYVNLLYLKDLHVEGKTEDELLEALREVYGTILEQPEISVKLLDFEKPYFIVGGEVHKPGKYDLRGDTTVSQAVHIAGSFTEAAKHSQVLLFRRVSDEWVEASLLDMKKMFKSGDLTEDLHLRPGDMVFVPKNTLSKIEPYLPRTDLFLWAVIGKKR